MSASTQVDICNLALANLGEVDITTIDDDITSAKALKKFYDECVSNLLKQYNWSFANFVDSDALTEATEPDWGYDHAYTLPADCVFVRSLSTGTTYDWQIVGDELWTDADTDVIEDGLRIEYTKSGVAISNWSQGFIDSLVAFLTYRLSYTLNTSANDAEYWRIQYERILANATAIDGQEQETPQAQAIIADSDSWLQSR